MSNLIYKVKNLLDAFREGEANVIGHQANCFHVMGSGIAPIIANEYPQVRTVDEATPKGDESKLGSFSVAVVNPDEPIDDDGWGGPKFIYNLYGQFTPGPDTRYEKLEEAMERMARSLTADYIRIGFPLLGCGLGGGDWKTVEAMIIRQFVDTGFDTSIYVLTLADIPDWVCDSA